MRKIAFDLDDCIAATWQQIAHRMEEEFHFPPGSLLPYNMGRDRLTEEQMRAFWDKYAMEIYRTIPPLPDAQRFMLQLWEEGYDISILTARKAYNDQIEPMTRQWLNQNGIPYHFLMMDAGTKAEHCRELGITLMVEDNPRNAEALVQQQINVVLVDQPYNQSFSHPLSVRVKHWEEVYRRVSHFFAADKVDRLG